MIESRFREYCKLTNEPVSAAVLTLASVISGQRPELETLLTPQEVAERLGVSDRTVHTLCMNGELRHSRVGRQYRISEEDLADYTNGERTVAGFMAHHM